MITKELLESFCSKDSTRPYLVSPFNVGEFTYATDGLICVRVPRLADYDDRQGVTDTISISVVNLGFENDVLFENLPTYITKVKAFKCKKCKGTGKECRCPDCDGSGEVEWVSDGGFAYEAECKMCRGSGTISGDNDQTTTCEGCGGSGEWSYTIINGVPFNTGLLEKIERLPQLKMLVLPQTVKYYKVVPFRFDGGAGVIMPRRMLEDNNG